MIDRSFIEKIEEMADAAESDIVINGRAFLRANEWQEVREPVEQELRFETLSGLIGFAQHAPFDPADAAGSMIAVTAHNEVALYGPVRPDKRRPMLAVAVFDSPSHPVFAGGARVEDAIIQMQVACENNDDLESLVRLLASVDEESTVTWDDDGLATSVTVKDGVSTRAVESFPRRVVLRPYCTFPQVEQPEQVFIPRLRKGGGGGGPVFQLHRVDSGRWREESVRAVADHIGEHVGEIPIVG